MTKGEMIVALKVGKRVKHGFVKEFKWIEESKELQTNKLTPLVTNNGIYGTYQTFIKTINKPYFAKGWLIV